MSNHPLLSRREEVSQEAPSKGETTDSPVQVEGVESGEELNREGGAEVVGVVNSGSELNGRDVAAGTRNDIVVGH
jgi:hypothetical protein